MGVNAHVYIRGALRLIIGKRLALTPGGHQWERERQEVAKCDYREPHQPYFRGSCRRDRLGSTA